ncbi:MAG: hypothetical protein WCS31_07015 [Verrucomicrobiae bacterium]
MSNTNTTNVSEIASDAVTTDINETAGTIETIDPAKVLSDYESALAAIEILKPKVVSSLESIIAENQAKLAHVTGKKKARAVKDGAEDRDPSKAVFEEYLEDPDKLDKEGMIRVRDWKSSMRPAVIEFAKENPDYEVVARGPHRFIKSATQAPVNPEVTVVAEIPTVAESDSAGKVTS